ncbi:hypothetical protein CRE_17984 [Caenorhabditis remanei]|uniref:F-box domain-containing protein n=1 Tax=Caenorhabditis remanei TaxID=31234 RepID=E3MDB6_CAERE|nr:hypothetical protein CRE_17984 [Caenorhabditis remanei]
MPPGLSYPALKCVLEFLDAPQRIHITARTPSLKQIDKVIPLRVKYLLIDDFTLRFNEFFMTCTPVNVMFGVWRTQKVLHESICPNRFSFNNNRDKLFESYFGARSIIYVDWLVSATGMYKPKSPQNFNFIINRLNTNNFGDFMPITNQFPMKELKIEAITEILLDHPVVHSAKNIIIEQVVSSIDTYLPDIHKLRAKNVSIQYSFKYDPVFTRIPYDLIRIIKYWIDHGKEIGTKYKFTSSFDDIYAVMTEAKREFNEFLSEAEKVDERVLIDLPQFYIPMKYDLSAKIFVYGIKIQEDGGDKSQVVVKVI